MKSQDKADVGIIIPFYKGKEWLKEALQSVSVQTYKHWTIYLINDGSPEDITDLSDLYSDMNLVIHNQENKGAAFARNRGISIAKEKYIAFLDADDLWEPTKLEEQISFLEQDEKYKWCHTMYTKVNENNTLMMPTHKDFLCGDVFIKSLTRCTIATPAVLIERSILSDDKLRFEENLNAGEDTLFWLRLLRKYPIGLINKPLVRVRMRGSNAASSIAAQIEGREAIYNYIKNENLKGSYVGILRAIYGYVHAISMMRINSGLINKVLYLPAWVGFKLLYKII